MSYHERAEFRAGAAVTIKAKDVIRAGKELVDELPENGNFIDQYQDAALNALMEKAGRTILALRRSGQVSFPPDWWTTDLEDEECDGCGVKPSKHMGHGAFTCQKCYEAGWCPKCSYALEKDHVCPSPEERAKRDEEWAVLNITTLMDFDDQYEIVKAMVRALREIADKEDAPTQRGIARTMLEKIETAIEDT